MTHDAWALHMALVGAALSTCIPLAMEQVALAARPAARPAQLSQTIVAKAAAAVEAGAPTAVAHLRYSRGSPLKVRGNAGAGMHGLGHQLGMCGCMCVGLSGGQ